MRLLGIEELIGIEELAEVEEDEEEEGNGWDRVAMLESGRIDEVVVEDRVG